MIEDTAADKKALKDGQESCRQVDPLVCLLEVTRELNSSDDLQAGLERFARALRTYVAYDTLAVLLLDERGQDLRFAVAVGYPPEVAEHWRFGIGQGIVGWAAKSGETVQVDDVARDHRFIDAGEGAGSELAIPLVSKGRTVGVLDLTSRQRSFFGPQDAQLLGFLAGHLASAIETARLYQNTRRQAQTLSVLHELTRELSSILDRDELLRRVASRLGRLVDYDAISVLLWQEEREELVPAVALFRDGRQLAWKEGIPLGHGICGTAAALRQPLLVPNVQVDPRFVPCSTGLEVRSELAVPLIFEGRLLGVLNVDSSEYDAFTSRDEQLLSTLGASLAIALDNARLYEQARAQEARMEQDLEMAREIQTLLLPKSSPWLPGLQVGFVCTPARHLGGDFYDFFPYADGSVAIAVGDVAGKGTAAALYGSLAVGMLREYSGQTPCSPSRVLGEMNRKLRRLGIANRFLAMTYAVYDGPTHTVRIANSGLPRPTLVRAGRAEVLEVVGVPLGLLAGPAYPQVEVSLEPGDLLVFRTDGLDEALNPRDEEFGEQRVLASLVEHHEATARELAEALVGDVGRWAAGREPYDDRTVLALKLTPEPPPR